MKEAALQIVPQEVIESKIFLIRGQKVMLDRDLAKLYGVTTGNLNKSVIRNLERFPKDFMFLYGNSKLFGVALAALRALWHKRAASAALLHVINKFPAKQG